MSFFQLLNQYSPAIQAITAVGIFLITGATVWFSIRMTKANENIVDEARLTRIEQTRPYVVSVVVRVPGSGPAPSDACYLVVRNDSSGRAFDLSFEVALTLNAETSGLLGSSFVTNGISYLGPHDERRALMFLDRPKDVWTQPVKVKISYRNALNQPFEQSFLVNVLQVM